MRFVEEFRDRSLVTKLAAALEREVAGRKSFTVMEVCGTHTMSIMKFGLKELLSAKIRLIAGPGCPVCVTPEGYVDAAVSLSGVKGVTVATFGDMMRVPGSRSSLERARAAGGDVRVVYSPLDAVALAERERGREVVFLGIGFETTAPTVAASIIDAGRRGIRNFSVLSAHKTMPEVIAALLEEGSSPVDGFLLPGHVSAITGTAPYAFIARRFKKGCVVAGFEPVDILQALLALVRQRKPSVEIQYTRVVRPGGNAAARRAIATVFRKVPSAWRGIGVVPSSGLGIRPSFSAFDASKRFSVDMRLSVKKEPRGCLCGDVVRGARVPTDCPLFGRRCTPVGPVGPCMVSNEGTCSVFYRYGDSAGKKGRVLKSAR